MTKRERKEVRAVQVIVSEVAWRLGRDHPEFDALMRAVTRLNSVTDPPPSREP